MQHILPQNMIVIDIETVSQQACFNDLDSTWKSLWTEKVCRALPENISAEEFYSMRAGVMAEFSKIVCISVGFFYNKQQTLHLRITSFYGADESEILHSFISAMNKIEILNNKWCFAGHNIKEFDMPFICRRMLINKITLPPYLDFQNMKPWETNILDTFQYWRFGDYKNFTSLKLLAACMGIPSPKDDIDGSMVGELYWNCRTEERIINLKRIAAYCQKDVLTTGNIILHFKNMPAIDPAAIEIVEK